MFKVVGISFGYDIMLDSCVDTAADEMILYLKSENDRLRDQVDELKSELAFIRHAFLRTTYSLMPSEVL